MESYDPTETFAELLAIEETHKKMEREIEELREAFRNLEEVEREAFKVLSATVSALKGLQEIAMQTRRDVDDLRYEGAERDSGWEISNYSLRGSDGGQEDGRGEGGDRDPEDTGA